MLDISIIFASLIMCLLIGLIGIKPKEITTFQDFITIPLRMKTSFVLFATIFASAIGSGSTLGLSQKLYDGRYEYLVAYILSLIWLFIIAKYLIKKIVKFDGYTIADIFYTRYGRIGQIIVGSFSVIFSLGHFAAQVAGCGLLFESFFGIDSIIGIIISYAIIISYSTIGGIRSVVKTDAIQVIIMFAGFIVLFTVIFLSPNLNININSRIILVDVTSSKFIINSFLLTLTFIVMTFYPHFVQRLLLTKDEKTLSNSLIGSIYGYLLFIFLISFISVKSQILVQGLTNNQNLFNILCNMLPQGIKGLVVASLIAALMSTADSDLNTAVVCLCRDLLQAKDSNDKIMLVLARSLTSILGIVFVFFALSYQNLLDLIIFLSGFWSPVILIPFVGLLYNKSINIRSFIFMTIVSVSSSYLWDMFYNGIYKIPGVLIGCLISLICFIFFFSLEKNYKTNIIT